MKKCRESWVEMDYHVNESRPTVNEFKNFSKYVYDFIRNDCDENRIAKVSFSFYGLLFTKYSVSSCFSGFFLNLIRVSHKFEISSYSVKACQSHSKPIEQLAFVELYF